MRAPTPAQIAELTADKYGFLERYDLSIAERNALVEPDFRTILELGGLPNLVFRYYRAHGLALDDFHDHLLGKPLAKKPMVQ
ncbi:MAG: hypothetical protein O3A21_03390 [Proteobacteria bacterium]|nr:hypothetical protein [Pseudomonadota bacterium]